MVVFKRYVGGLNRLQTNLQESGRQLAFYGDLPLVIPPEAWERRGEMAGSCENSHTRFVHRFQGGPTRRGRRMGTSPLWQHRPRASSYLLPRHTSLVYALREPGRTSRAYRPGSAHHARSPAPDPPNRRSAYRTSGISRPTSLLPSSRLSSPAPIDFNTVTWGANAGAAGISTPVGQGSASIWRFQSGSDQGFAVERTNWRLLASPPIRVECEDAGASVEERRWRGGVGGGCSGSQGGSVCSFYWSQGFSARPRPAGPGRRAAAVAAAAAGSASESGPEGGRRRCLCRGDGPVCTISAGAHPGLLRPLCGRAV